MSDNPPIQTPSREQGGGLEEDIGVKHTGACAQKKKKKKEFALSSSGVVVVGGGEAS